MARLGGSPIQSCTSSRATTSRRTSRPIASSRSAASRTLRAIAAGAVHGPCRPSPGRDEYSRCGLRQQPQTQRIRIDPAPSKPSLTVRTSSDGVGACPTARAGPTRSDSKGYTLADALDAVKCVQAAAREHGLADDRPLPPRTLAVANRARSWTPAAAVAGRLPGDVQVVLGAQRECRAGSTAFSPHAAVRAPRPPPPARRQTTVVDAARRWIELLDPAQVSSSASRHIR